MQTAIESDRKARSLTKRQSEILGFICDRIHHRGCAPTVREIGRQMKISSPNGVLCHLKALEKKGYIRREENRARAIQLTNMPGQPPWKPMLRELQASRSFESLLDAEWMDFGLLFETGHFLFRVCGNAWAAEHLIEGDFLVMRNGATKAELRVVAIVHPDATTLSQVIQDDQELRLVLSDSRSIAVQDAEILGIVVGVIRCF